MPCSVNFNVKRSSVSLLTVICLLASPAAAAGDDTLARLVRPAPVSTLDGRIFWSEYDPSTNLFYLTQRFGPTTARLPVVPRSVPFDVDVGRNIVNQSVLTYSRCRREPVRRDPRASNVLAQMPQWSTGRGCDVHLLNLQTNAETRVPGASTRGASEFLPTIWRRWIVFARVYEHRRGRAGERAYLYLHTRTRSGGSRRLPAGPRGRERFCSGKPKRCSVLPEPGPTTLDLTGRFLAFGWDSTNAAGATSAVYLEKLRARSIAQRLVARGGSGDVQARELLGPQVDHRGRMVWIESLFGESTRSEVGRFTIHNGERSSAPLQPVAGEQPVRTIIGSAVDGATPLYLASGLSVGVGCSYAQPCELRTATNLKFSPPKRSGRSSEGSG